MRFNGDVPKYLQSLGFPKDLPVEYQGVSVYSYPVL